MVKGKRTLPAQARRLADAPDLPARFVPIRVRKSIPDSWIELQLTEGRNRQVRRMTAVVGHPTLRLVRWAIGSITLDGLSTRRLSRARRSRSRLTCRADSQLHQTANTLIEVPLQLPDSVDTAIVGAGVAGLSCCASTGSGWSDRCLDRGERWPRWAGSYRRC